MGTKYIFKVYVEDSMGYKSMIYELNKTTDELHYFIVRKVLNGYFSLNGERIAVEVNNPIYYEVGDILTYSHSQACAENEILVNQLSNSWGYDYEPIVLYGTEKYIEEYEEGRCEPS